MTQIFLFESAESARVAVCVHIILCRAIKSFIALYFNPNSLREMTSLWISLVPS